MLELEGSIYNGGANPRNRMVEMFHSGTPDSVKDHVLQSLSSNDGHIRILICTIAFGMGVDCKNISRIIHFGGSNCIESYLQECGRAGRNGTLSTCYLLHNEVLLKHCGDDIKNYVASTICRRRDISSMFPSSNFESEASGCVCCKFQLNLFENLPKINQPARLRPVAPAEKNTLLEKLESYHQCLLPRNVDSCPTVAFGNIILEFGKTQIV